ncbi:MAG: hypothetical protein IIU68_05385, partial [Bacteroidales bacterium]|nr:hypothetical protein [Bacteroidales bacterium]
MERDKFQSVVEQAAAKVNCQVVEIIFDDDKNRIIEKYNELGYRDAKITFDSVAQFDDKHVDVYL